MSDYDKRLIKNLRAVGSVSEYHHRGIITECADRLEQLTAAAEPVEGSVEVRFAIATDGRSVAAHGIYGTIDDLEAMQYTHDDLRDVATHQAIATCRLPRAIPAIVAQVEEAKP